MLKFDQLAGSSGKFNTAMGVKALLNNMYGTMSQTPPFKKVSAWRYSNGETWYTVSMRKDVSIWFHEQFADQEDTMWRATNDTNWTSVRTEMNEKLYIMLELRWS